MKTNIIELLSNRMYIKQRREFADYLLDYSEKLGYKVGSRDVAYSLEGDGAITKDQFEKVNTKLGELIKEGLLPIDFVDGDPSRAFHGVSDVDVLSIKERFRSYVKWIKNIPDNYDLDWWDGEKYYIQMLVEKRGLQTIFKDITDQYKIPIANGRGQSSILLRGEMSQRFKEAEEKGLIPVLLYFGDFDPAGIVISDGLMRNLESLRNVYWEDGREGYDPKNLIIHRFGLNRETIDKHDLIWINNLMTASGVHLAEIKNGKIVAGKVKVKDKKTGKLKVIDHPNFKLPATQKYLNENGVRKVEANAVMKDIKMAQRLCKDAIEKFLGVDAEQRFTDRTESLKPDFELWLEETGFDEYLDEMIQNNDS